MEWYWDRELREKARAYVEEHQLISVMNDTKWDRFRRAMEEEMPFPPAYHLKTLFDPPEEIRSFKDEKEVWYGGDYDREAFAGWLYYLIEWVQVVPRYWTMEGGRLVHHPVLHDAEPQLRAILEQYRIPYACRDHIYTIRGYLPSGEGLECELRR